MPAYLTIGLSVYMVIGIGLSAYLLISPKNREELLRDYPTLGNPYMAMVFIIMMSIFWLPALKVNVKIEKEED